MGPSTRSKFEAHSLRHYAQEVRGHLPAEIFQPAPGRLLWIPAHLLIIGALAAYVVEARPAWWIGLLCGVVAGHSWGCLAFVAHEALHQTLTPSRPLQRLAGICGFAIHCLSPTLWIAWHNQAHHGNTGRPMDDPDTFGMLTRWQSNALVRWLVKLAPGSGQKRSGAFLFFWFSFHAVVVLLFHSERQSYYTRISRRAVIAETAAMLAFWIAVLCAIGPRAFAFVYVVPLLVANATVMSYVATNHFLNVYTETNDPLVNTLSVTAPRWLEVLHLQFGYHVEHHIFPGVSGRHARTVRAVLQRLYGDRYLTMPLSQALRLLYERPKIHDTYDTLIDPATRSTYNALLPGDLSMSPAAPRSHPGR